MIGFYSLVFAIGIAFSGFLITTYNGFSKFQSQTNQLVNYETTALASSNRIAKESAEFLTSLKESLRGVNEMNDPHVTTFLRTGCKAISPAELLEELITDLEAHSENQLSSTISYGLKGKEDYKLELVHSDYIPAKLKDSDKTYVSVILSDKSVILSDKSVILSEAKDPMQNFEIQSTEDLSRFIENEKLKVSKTLLNDLFSEEKVEEILTKQDELGLIVSSDGLRMTDLPNGLRLFLNKSVILSEAKNPMHQDSALDPSSTVQDDTDEYLSRTSIAQIRVGEVEEKIGVVDPPVVVNPPLVNPPVTQPPVVIPPVSEPAIEVRRLELAINMVPLSQRGFLYDSNQPIDINNPLQIINRKEGGYSSIFIRDDGFLQISIGSISKKLGNQTANIDYFDKATLSLDTVTLSFDDQEFNSGDVVKVTEDRKVSLDIDPRGRTSYSVAKKDFIVNDVIVPKGSIIAGIKETGVYEQHPEIGEFEQFRVYDPNTGGLVTYFGQGELKDAGCAGSKDCFDVKQFAQPEGTTQNNARVFYSFSLQDLMPSSSAYDSVDYWINIQKDLTENMTLGLNSKDAQWQKEELKALNDAMSVYTGYDKIDKLTVNDTAEINSLLKEYETGGVRSLKRSLGISDELPTLSKASYSDDELVQLQIKLGAKNDALVLFALNKLKTWGDKENLDSKSNRGIQDQIDKLNLSRNQFFSARGDYDKYIQEYGNSPNLLTKRDLQDLLADPNLPADLRAEYQAELDKIIQEEERLKKEAAEQEAERQRVLEEGKRIANEIYKSILQQQVNGYKADLASLQTQLANQQEKKAKLKKQGKSLSDIKSNIAKTQKAIVSKQFLIQTYQELINNLG